jgi:hypothetical protein
MKFNRASKGSRKGSTMTDHFEPSAARHVAILATDHGQFEKSLPVSPTI